MLGAKTVGRKVLLKSKVLIPGLAPEMKQSSLNVIV
jgi:hypothetical protein